jgi:hypothetical protein
VHSKSRKKSVKLHLLKLLIFACESLDFLDGKLISNCRVGTMSAPVSDHERRKQISVRGIAQVGTVVTP